MCGVCRKMSECFFLLKMSFLGRKRKQSHKKSVVFFSSSNCHCSYCFVKPMRTSCHREVKLSLLYYKHCVCSVSLSRINSSSLSCVFDGTDAIKTYPIISLLTILKSEFEFPFLLTCSKTVSNNSHELVKGISLWHTLFANCFAVFNYIIILNTIFMALKWRVRAAANVNLIF